MSNLQGKPVKRPTIYSLAGQRNGEIRPEMVQYQVITPNGVKLTLCKPAGATEYPLFGVEHMKR